VNGLKQYFDVLELVACTSIAEVKNQYRDLIQVWHPDKYSHNIKLQQKAEEKMKILNNAMSQIEQYYKSYGHLNDVESNQNVHVSREVDPLDKVKMLLAKRFSLTKLVVFDKELGVKWMRNPGQIVEQIPLITVTLGWLMNVKEVRHVEKKLEEFNSSGEGSTKWRLPIIDEFESLIKIGSSCGFGGEAGNSAPATRSIAKFLTEVGFKGVKYGDYWTYSKSGDMYYAVDMLTGDSYKENGNKPLNLWLVEDSNCRY